MRKCSMKKDDDGIEVIHDFGEDFGTLVKQDIGELFIEIHASVSPLDPLFKYPIDQDHK